MTNEQLFTDREWGEAKMFGQYEQRENREEVVVFRRVDLASYVSMIRAYDEVLVAATEREACAKVCDECERANLYGHRECAALIRGRGE